MAAANQEIRTLLATLTGGTVMLPGSVVAEIINFSDPKPLRNAPAWLLGEVGWSDWNVPVISFASLAGKCKREKATPGNRVLVLKSLSESPVTPYFGILISGVPRLVKVSEDSLSKQKKLDDHPCVFREVTIGEERALIPELNELTRIVEEAMIAQLELRQEDQQEKPA
jgi:chemosensory pili system protein ChpC